MIVLESCQYSPENSSPENSARFVLAVDSLRINKGERVFIIGPSGSGKTTLLKALAGLLPHCTAQLSIDGERIDYAFPKNDRGLMYLCQELGLWPHLTCMEHLAFVVSRGRSLQDDRAYAWLDMVGLQHRYGSRPHQLSGGERKRLALARALAVEPQYLFLDEPFANIDLVQARELMALIDEQQVSKGFSLIKVTHHSMGIEHDGLRILVVNQGRLVQQGFLADIVSHPADEWTQKWVRLIT